MQCPACDNPMMVLEYDLVEVDFCDECGGIWLDAEELEMLFGEREMAEKFMDGAVPDHIEKDRKLTCPISDKPLLKGRTQGDPPVTYDYSVHGMWFDHGELGAILHQGSQDPGGEKVIAWLRELFPDEAKQ